MSRVLQTKVEYPTRSSCVVVPSGDSSSKTQSDWKLFVDIQAERQPAQTACHCGLAMHVRLRDSLCFARPHVALPDGVGWGWQGE